MPSEEEALDEFTDFLHYFENHRQEEKVPELKPDIQPTIVATPAEGSLPCPALSITRAPILDDLEEDKESTPLSDFGELNEFVLSAAWSTVRTTPSDLNTLLLLGEPIEDQPHLPDEQSLFDAKIERIVAQLPLQDSQERTAYRKLLEEFPINTSRKAIQRLIDSGRTPRAIRRVVKVRKRCHAVFLELDRWTLWGPRFTKLTNNQTVSWALADKLHQAGVESRSDLFRFFRGLCDRLSTSRVLEQQYGGALNFAEQLLPELRLPPSYRDFTSQTTAGELAACGIDEKWKWQNPATRKLSRKGLPLRTELAYFIKDEAGPSVQFVPYRRAKNSPSVDPDSERSVSEYLLWLVMVEGPVSYKRLKLQFASLIAGSETPLKLPDVLHRIFEKLAWRGDDIWYYRDLPRSGRLPRRPDGDGSLSLDDSTDFDLGSGFDLLRRIHPSTDQSDNELQLLHIWKAPKGELLVLQAAIARFQKNYLDRGTHLR